MVSGRHERFASGNPAAAEHYVVFVKNRSLSGRYRALSIMQPHMRSVVVQYGDRRKRSRMIVPDLGCRFK
jgi:hypothetical protein